MRGGPQESDAVFGEQFGELGFLGGVPPAGPHGLHRYALGYVENEVDVSVIVIVGASRNGNIVIGQPNVFSVGLKERGGREGREREGREREGREREGRERGEGERGEGESDIFVNLLSWIRGGLILFCCF